MAKESTWVLNQDGEHELQSPVASSKRKLYLIEMWGENRQAQMWHATCVWVVEGLYCFEDDEGKTHRFGINQIWHIRETEL